MIAAYIRTPSTHGFNVHLVQLSLFDFKFWQDREKRPKSTVQFLQFNIFFCLLFLSHETDGDFLVFLGQSEIINVCTLHHGNSDGNSGIGVHVCSENCMLIHIGICFGRGIRLD